MLSPAIQHVGRALIAAGLNKDQLKLRKSYEGVYRGPTPVAFVNHGRARLRRDGSQIPPTTDASRRRLWDVPGTVRLELFCKDERQYDETVAALLEHLYDHSFEVEGRKLRFPDGDITASFTNEEGILMGEFAVLLEIPYQMELLRGYEFVQFELVEESVAFVPEE
jgi:hypothetical protein